MDAEEYAAFTRAVSNAVQHINADKRKYAQYFIDHHKSDPDVAALTVDDFNLSRIQVTDPSPIPDDELERTRQWMISWKLLEPATSADSLVDAQRQTAAHRLASASNS